MQKIIPFKKDIVFKDRIDEISSISMDHHLIREEYIIKGEFTVEGEFITNAQKEPFHFDIPYLGNLDDNYEVEKCVIDIDDFYYEIMEPNKLMIHIDILVDKLSEKPLIIEEIPTLVEEDLKEEREEFMEEKEEVIEENRKEIVSEKEVEEENRVENVAEVTKVFDSVSNEAYMTYRVYIVREGDTISSILEKYQINEEDLRKYNVINELSLGDKLIIPNEKN